MLATSQLSRRLIYSLVALALATPANAEKPLCTIAAISNPYITSLDADQLGERSWLKTTAPAGLRDTLALVAGANPDALVVMGSLTWSGSDADYALLQEHLTDVKTPLYLMPGPRDLVDGGLSRFRKSFPRRGVVSRSVQIKGVHLQFAGSATPNADDQKLLDWMAEDFKQSASAHAVLLFGGPDWAAPTKTTPSNSPQARYWRLIRRHKVAARFVASHSHFVTLQDRLPVWSIPSSAWTSRPKWKLALITVYPQRLDLQLVLDEGQPMQSLVVPNPRWAEPLPRAADDPYGVPTYTQDLKRQPELTFVQLSDSQFDDGAIPRYRSRFRYDEQMNKLAVLQVNRLNPALVFMTGDLTNKNTPAEWKTFKQIYSQLKPPLYTLPGNHDTLQDRRQATRQALGDLYETSQQNWRMADNLAGRPSADRMALYRHFTGRKPHFTVEKNGCAFHCLNTWFGAVDSEQLDWLESELERTKKARHVFVLGHYPILDEFGGNIRGAAAQRLLHLFRRYKVAAYLSGHRHRYSYRVHDGTAHVLCDCLCWGEYLSYQIYHVFPDRIISCWKPIFRADGNRPLYERVVFPEPRRRVAN